MTKKILIGELLVQEKQISNDQLQTALQQQKETGKKLGTTLIELGAIDELSFLQTLSRQLDIPFIDLRRYDFDTDIIHRLPEAYSRQFHAIALEDLNGELLVGMVDPLDIFAFDEIYKAVKQPIRQAIVQESELNDITDLLYRHTQEINSFARELSDEVVSEEYDLDKLPIEGSDDAPVIKLLQSLFEDAVQVGASDIHIEPDDNILRIRQRIDGQLHEHTLENKEIAPTLALRLKLMAKLDIAEKRVPQDGRFHLKANNKLIDVRLSTMPTQHGESVVMRLLDQSSGLLQLEQLGMPDDILTRLRNLIQQPYGMVLVTGPTGSGKTTTLYSALHELNQPEIKIITVEDPIEYRLPRINQVQVNSAIHLDFVRVLRSALRHDPDVIMVGEIRDPDTATIAMRAAMTGHLVLATLHTNDAMTSAMRLVDMGAKSYMVGSALRAVMSQRLIRRICSYCIEDYQPNDQEHNWLAGVLGEQLSKTKFKIGQGCAHCNRTGYRGRTGVFELLELNEAMIHALHSNDSSAFADAAKQNEHAKPLGQSVLALATQGITSVSEAMRLSSELT